MSRLDSVIAPELRSRIEAERNEILRIYALPDRWLAAELLRLTRSIREATSYAERPETDTYNSTVLWDVIPEIARRLGATIQQNESTNWRFRSLEGEKFREYVAVCIANVGTGYLKDARLSTGIDPVAILFREVANGNPIIIGLDRLVPPGNNSIDHAARHIREISRTRGHEVVSSWSPMLNNEPEPAEAPHP